MNDGKCSNTNTRLIVVVRIVLARLLVFKIARPGAVRLDDRLAFAEHFRRVLRPTVVAPTGACQLKGVRLRLDGVDDRGDGRARGTRRALQRARWSKLRERTAELVGRKTFGPAIVNPERRKTDERKKDRTHRLKATFEGETITAGWGVSSRPLAEPPNSSISTSYSSE